MKGEPRGQINTGPIGNAIPDYGTVGDRLNGYQQILDLVQAHDEMMSATLNLVASGNLISPAQRRCLQSDLLCRAAEGRVGERVFPGLQYFDAIEAYGQKIVSRMLGDCEVDLRPISGSQANLAVLSALTKPGDRVLTVALQHGGHISLSGKVTAGLLGIERIYIPWDERTCDISYTNLLKVAEDHQPTVIVVGGSVMIYPPKIRKVVEIAKAIGAKTVYDASHTAAFVLTGLHENPLESGIDVLTFTTCKTIPGPSHAVIACKKELAEGIGARIFPGLVSGGHLNELVAAILAICELETFGREYAENTVMNAQILAKALLSRGLPIIRDPSREITETHQILLDCREFGGGSTIEHTLETGGILVNRNLLWWDRSFKTTSGVRLGTQEVTRLGMGPQQMLMIADWIVQMIRDGKRPSMVAAEIRQLREAYQDPQYCYNPFM